MNIENEKDTILECLKQIKSKIYLLLLIMTSWQIEAQVVCNPITSSFTEGFEGFANNTISPGCWNFIDGGTGSGFVAQISDAANTGSKYYYMTSSTDSSGNYILVSPETDNFGNGTFRVKFFARSSTDGTSLIVGTLSSPNDAGTFTANETISLTTTYTEYAVNLSGSDSYFGFKHGGISWRTIYLDDVVYEPQPACPDVSGLNAGALSNSATLSWAGLGTAYDIEYVLGTEDFTGTPTVSNVSNNYNIDGLLQPNTTYKFRVRQNCSSDDEGFGVWSSPFTFTTACAAITSFPFTEDFETDSSYISCWSNQYIEGSHNWIYATGSTSTLTTAHSGDRNARFVSISGTNYPITKLISPLLNLTALSSPKLSLYYAQPNWSNDTNELKVYYRVNPTSAWVEMAHYTETKLAWTEVILDLPNPSATYQIAFEGINNYGRANVIDLVTVYNSAPTSTLPESVQIQVANNASNEITVNNGTLQLEVSVTPSQANQAINWSIASGNEFASVSENGLVTAIANGTVTVRATSFEDETKFAEIDIVVSNQVLEFPVPYCGDAAITSLTVSEITEVVFAGITKVSNIDENPATTIEDFTSTIFNVNKGESYPITVKGGTHGQTTVSAYAYIDFNQNNIFEENESFNLGYLDNSNPIEGVQSGVTTGNLLIPSDALSGETKFRIVKAYESNSWMGELVNTACPQGWFIGQVEDYTINVQSTSTPDCDNTDPGINAGDTGCVSFMYNGAAVSYMTVRGADGHIWLQQNLGSDHVATEMTDGDSYGDLFQWGRWADGHQKRNSVTTSTAPVPNNPLGITNGLNAYITSAAWWSTNELNDQWSAPEAASVTGTNGCDPCKALGEGWRLPTQSDWSALVQAEGISNPSTAFASNLKLPASGYRSGSSGALTFAGTRGYYWSSETANTGGKYLYIGTTLANPSAGGPRSQGASIRCVKAGQSPAVVTSVEVTTENGVDAAITENGGTLQLVATVNPGAANQNVTWSIVSGDAFASVDANGLITSLANGTVTVRAASAEDETKYDEITVIISHPAGQTAYCDVTVEWGITPISAVAFGNLNNQTSAVVDGTLPYEDFTAMIAQVEQGNTYTLTVEGNTDGSFTHDIRVFIDWDQNFVFDMNTEYYHASLLPSTGEDGVQATVEISIPENAVLGHTRMRIIKDHWNVYEPGEFDACTDAYYGQIEDYTVNIIEPGTGISVESVTVSVANDTAPQITVENGTLQLVATVNPSNANQEVTWSVTSGESFASVNQNGLVTAIGNGTATVRTTSVADNTKFDDIEIVMDYETVTAIESVVVSVQDHAPAQISEENGTLQLVAAVHPSGANQEVSWSVTSGEAFVSVDQNGLVTASSTQGISVIRATSLADETKFDEIEINVVLSLENTERLKTEIYPNPTTGMVHIQSETEVKEIRVYDVTGKQVMSTNQKTIDLSALPSGTYIFKIEFVNERSLSRKIIKN